MTDDPYEDLFVVGRGLKTVVIVVVVVVTVVVDKSTESVCSNL